MKLGTGMGLTNGREMKVSEPDFTKLLLHFDSEFSDSSSFDRPPTVTGAPSIDTGKKVFGAGSLIKNTSQVITYPASTDWFIGNGIPWQLSFRLYSPSPGRTPVEVFFGTNNWFGPGWILFSENSWSVLRLTSNGSIRAQWQYSFPANVWTAHRVNHDGIGTARWYVNGVLLDARSATGISNANAPLYVGGRPGGNHFTGNMDEVLWEKHPDLVITTEPTYEVETEPFVNP